MKPEKASFGYEFKIHMPKPAGYFVLWDDYRVECRTKPEQKHIDAMRQAFGWEWVDAGDKA